jgi:uncharacterized damage-inducible protein DinB
MTWTAPDVDRRAEPGVVDERAMLEGWLDYHRQTLLVKCAGLSAEQLRLRSVPPSSLSLLGLVRHMTDVERWWFRRCLRQEPVSARYWSDASPDGDFDEVDSADPEADFAAFADEVEAARRAAEGRDLDETFRHPPSNRQLSLRWVYAHMIEEYARHNGHADLIRERIDGTTGD